MAKEVGIKKATETVTWMASIGVMFLRRWVD